MRVTLIMSYSDAEYVMADWNGLAGSTDTPEQTNRYSKLAMRLGYAMAVARRAGKQGGEGKPAPEVKL